ncbi:MAG: Eco57I restriction-modification methylase domain-containing protein [Candidatus Thorarchaeota archaeon]
MHYPYPDKSLRYQVDIAIHNLVKELKRQPDIHDGSIQPITCFLVNYAVASCFKHSIGNRSRQRIKIEDIWGSMSIIAPTLERWSGLIQDSSGISIPRATFRSLERICNMLFRKSYFWDAFTLISENALHHTSSNTKLTSKSSLGRFPTPFALANYLLEKMLENCLQKATIEEILQISFLDPAAGSGTFVGIAYDILLAHYRRMEEELGEIGFSDLSIPEIILRNNLYAVDITEGSRESLSFGIRLRSLCCNAEPPEEMPNFRIGNALLDAPHQKKAIANFLLQSNSGSRSSLVSNRNEKAAIDLLAEKIIPFPKGNGPRFKPFLWQREFPDIFLKKDNPGFDLIAGNPPYVNIERLTRAEYKFFTNKNPKIYKTAVRRFDLYVLFLEKILTDLLRNKGKFGLILSDKLLTETYAKEIRRLILSKVRIDEIVDLRNWITFPGVAARTIMLRGEVKDPADSQITVRIPEKDPLISEIENGRTCTIRQKAFRKIPNYMFRLRWDHFRDVLTDHIHSMSLPLGNFCYVSWGAQPGQVKRVIYQKVGDQCINPHQNCPKHKKGCSPALCKMLIKGRDVDHYKIEYRDRLLLYDPVLLNRPAFPQLFENEKIVVREVSGNRGLIAALDTKGYYTDHSLSCIILKKSLVGMPLEDARRRGIKFCLDKKRLEKGDNFSKKFAHFDQKDESPAYTRGTTVHREDLHSSFGLGALLAILNSSLLGFYFREYLSGGLNVFPGHIKQLPIPRNLSSGSNAAISNIIERAARFLQADKNQQNPLRMELLRAIDRLVYTLYNISDEWITKIEKSAQCDLPSYDESLHYAKNI